MMEKMKLFCAVAGMVFTWGVNSVQAAEYNLATDYSTNSNPNGTWSYGWDFANQPPSGGGIRYLTPSDEAWVSTNGVAIYKDVSGGIVLQSSITASAMIRWTAPADIGRAAIRIEGELPPLETGIEIRRGGGVILSVTNASVFSVDQLVEPGEQIDFVVVDPSGASTKRLSLTITPLSENLQLTTFEDFNSSYPEFCWTGIPGWKPLEGRPEGSPATNYFAEPEYDTMMFGGGMSQDMPFNVSTNSGITTIRHFSKLGPRYPNVYDSGRSGIGFAHSSVTSNANAIVFEYMLYAHANEPNPTVPHISVTDGEGSVIHLNTELPVNTWIEFRSDIDWSYVGSDGKYGLFSLFMRTDESHDWYPVSELQGFEMKISDPAEITKLCVLLHHSTWGYLPQIDDIRYSNGENPNLGTGTNLLVNGSIDQKQLGWRNDDVNHQRLLYYQNVIKLASADVGVTSRVSQVVSLLGQGFAEEEIDAGLYRTVFGGSLHWDGGEGEWPYDGRIGIDYLDSTNGLIGTANTPDYVYEYEKEWKLLMATNQIPARTRFIRYNYYTQGGQLNNATLSVLGIPQEDVSLTVSSVHGTPVPSVGTTSNTWGTVVTCSVDHVTMGTTQYACTGWIGTGSVPATGTSNAVAVTLTQDSSITWLWQTNYWLEAVTSGQGQVVGGDVWAATDSQIGLTAVPETGWLFMGWSGDAAGTNDVTLLMDEPKSVTAVFSDDADGDGLTNTQEAEYGSDPRKSDTDGDGFNDKLEVDNGGSPTVSDAWRVDYIRDNAADFNLSTSNSVIDIAVGQMLLETTNGIATLYLQLEQSDDLESWTNAGEAVIWEIPNDSPTQFFRVRSEK